MPDRTYRFTERLGLPSILGDTGWQGMQKIKNRIDELEEKGFGEGISGRIKYTGSHSYTTGNAFLLGLSITAEYDSPEDKQKIIDKITEVTGTQTSRMLWFT